MYPAKEPVQGYKEEDYTLIETRLDTPSGNSAGIKKEIGGPCRIRTYDQLIKSQLLYQLS